MNTIKIYNPRTRQKEPLATIEPGVVKMYVCGPTVYNFFHVGNARCFTIFDFIRRFLVYMGYKVNYVQNFTDIDDKMINAAKISGSSVADIAARFIGEYQTDAAGLGITPADAHPLATEHIPEIIELISILIDKAHAYTIPAGDNLDVYFSVSSFSGYGGISGMNMEQLRSAENDNPGEGKREPMDFALWKAYKEGEPFWDSPWGKGRPGWHIECSAMARKYLGESIDIHCGGQDLCFPHHENEAAQSEAAYGKPFVRYWMRNGMININDQKMGKSAGNFFMIRDAAEKYGYEAFRFYILSAHYRSPVNYSEDIIISAKASYERIMNCGENLDFTIANSGSAPEKSADDNELISILEGHKASLIAALCDDFNTADAVAALFELVRSINTALTNGGISKAYLSRAREIYDELCGLFGFIPTKTAAGGIGEDEINALIEKRTKAKNERDWSEADRIRDELKQQGIILEDTSLGVKWKRM